MALLAASDGCRVGVGGARQAGGRCGRLEMAKIIVQVVVVQIRQRLPV